jgi:hypothetical protein
LRTYLSLTDAQANEMRRAGEQAARQVEEKAKTVQPQIREKRAALDAAMAKGNDPAAVGKLMLEIRALEKQVGDAQRAGREAFVSSLTPEQKARFKAIEDAALLPIAAREAVRMGLVPGATPRMQPGMQSHMQPGMQNHMQPGMQNHMQPGMQNHMQPGQNPGPPQGPRPAMMGQPGQPGPGQPGQPGPGQPGHMMMRRGQPGQPPQPAQPPQAPQPPRPEEE